MSLLAPAATERVTWARVSEGFFVGSRSGDYVGCVERTPDGNFVGFDFRSTPVGRYASLAEAQRAVGGAQATRPLTSPEPSARTQMLWQGAASISGVLALGALAAAVLTTPLI